MVTDAQTPEEEGKKRLRPRQVNATVNNAISPDLSIRTSLIMKHINMLIYYNRYVRNSVIPLIMTNNAL